MTDGSVRVLLVIDSINGQIVKWLKGKGVDLLTIK